MFYYLNKCSIQSTQNYLFKGMCKCAYNLFDSHSTVVMQTNTYKNVLFLQFAFFLTYHLGKLKNAFHCNRIIVCCWTWKSGENLKKKNTKNYLLLMKCF